MNNHKIRSKYNPELLSERVRNSFSWASVCRLYGLRENGGSHALIKRLAISYGIDYSHFTGQGHRKGKSLPKKILSEYLIKREDGIRTTGQKLRKALLSIGIEDVCIECGQLPTHNNKPLTLQVDHIDGDYTNNRPNNLRIICPNCHSQTETFCGRQKAINATMS